MSNFDIDLANEIRLAKFLDENYYNNKKIFPDRFILNRCSDMNKQHQGIDIEIKDTKHNIIINIDEKAQLAYINKNLPTFAFELSYIKDNQYKKGWLFDVKKQTDRYFLLTSIKEIDNNFVGARLISVDRYKLISLLESKKLNSEKLKKYDEYFRKTKKYGKNIINELSSYEGFIFYTNTLAEEPVNIVLYLNYLIKEGIGKEIFPAPFI
ncbi:hypothetical protein HOO31_03030 [Aliarcobacter cryaerophilus]|uniref:hypothetical protein n=1 Tax=Aliarcobacter cryaerophilus TaxID=28198 RepID=UPI00164ACFA4|nr:hypothetical protein [Aliarcobacter cryaerophilus]QNK85596.1 hypothetical protein HOO31_03030 [Aliarcobacter cryaerophilus]